MDWQFTQPGTQEFESFNLCNEQMGIHCLHQHLQLKPCLNDSVLAKLPTGARINPSLPPPERKRRRPSPSNKKHSAADVAKGMQPVVVVDNECKKINCDCLRGDGRRKEHREMVADHKNPVRLAMETKRPMKESQDDNTFHNMLGCLLEGCIAKMSDLGGKLGCI